MTRRALFFGLLQGLTKLIRNHRTELEHWNSGCILAEFISGLQAGATDCPDGSHYSEWKRAPKFQHWIWLWTGWEDGEWQCNWRWQQSSNVPQNAGLHYGSQWQRWWLQIRQAGHRFGAFEFLLLLWGECGAHHPLPATFNSDGITATLILHTHFFLSMKFAKSLWKFSHKDDLQNVTYKFLNGKSIAND